MEIIYEMGDDILIAELYGEMDHHSSEKIRHDIDEMLDLYGMHHLIMDSPVYLTLLQKILILVTDFKI